MAREKIKFALRIAPETQQLVKELCERDNRTDFTGVLKEEFLPGWAREKLEELQGQNAGMGGMEMT